MGIPRIIEKVYREPWLIKPSVHGSISTSLLTHIKGEAKACDFEDEYEEYNAEHLLVVSIGVWYLHISDANVGVNRTSIPSCVASQHIATWLLVNVMYSCTNGMNEVCYLD